MAWNDNLQQGTPAYDIVASAHDRIRVLAGPGSGKSFAMKRRVARLLEVENVNAAEILAVTFTRVAAEDLHRELLSLNVPGAAGLSGRTLHSLAMTVLMRNHVLAVLGRTPRPLNAFELEPLLADLSNVHGNKHARRRLIRAYGAAWARLQTEQPGFARDPADQAFADELVDWLQIHEAMLMDEVIPHLYRYLSQNPGAPELTEYSHILIDEYQDLNRAEQEVLQLLGQRAAMCVVGDDNQSIYSFRHAHPEAIRQWAVPQPTERHAIAECRRCPVTVVRMANALIAHNPGGIGGAMTECAANGPGEVVVRQFRNVDQETDAVADKVASLIGHGIEPREIIILAQRRNLAGPIYRKLRDRGVPTKSYYAESALDTLAAQERFATLKLLLNNEDRVALRWLLGRGHNSWLASPYRRILNHVRQNGISPWVTLSALSAGTIRIPYTTPLVNRFREIQAELARLEAAADFQGFLDQWLPDDEDTELLSDAVEICSEGVDNAAELYTALYELITQPEVPLEVADVRIMSLHKSKGLSAPYVFIVGCVEGLLPSHPRAGASQAERDAKLQEDRRLFYVGITRTKASPPNHDGYLSLTYSQRMPAADAYGNQIVPARVVGNVAHLHPSRFFGEMAPHVPAARFNEPL